MSQVQHKHLNYTTQEQYGQIIQDNLSMYMRTEVSGRFQTSLCAGFNVVISPLEPEPSARSQMTEETKKKKREVIVKGNIWWTTKKMKYIDHRSLLQSWGETPSPQPSWGSFLPPSSDHVHHVLSPLHQLLWLLPQWLPLVQGWRWQTILGSLTPLMAWMDPSVLELKLLLELEFSSQRNRRAYRT